MISLYNSGLCSELNSSPSGVIKQFSFSHLQYIVQPLKIAIFSRLSALKSAAYDMSSGIRTTVAAHAVS